MIVMAALILVLQSAAPFEQSQQAQNAKASIEGFVVRAGTNEPVARARVTVFRTAGPGGSPLQQAGPPQTIPPMTTDSQGHFVFRDLDPGSYSVTAQRNGFARQAYGERATGRPGAPLTILAGQALKDVVFRLVPAGTVGGRVTDSTGEPIAGISITIGRFTYDPTGKRTFQPINFARTDDRGEYRMYWITPGRYYVNASPASAFIGFRTPNSNEVVEPGYVPTWYPGTTDESSTAAIELQAGAELRTVDFTLTQQPLFRIRGRVFDARTRQAARNANVSVNPMKPTGGFGITPSSVNYNSANGTFEIRDVPPGSYWVRAINFANPGGGPYSGDTAQVPLEISNVDIENVVLVLTPGFQIKGRIELEGGSLSTLPNIERTRVFLTPLEPMPFGSPQDPIKPDGSFTIDNVHPGEYRINLGMPQNTFIQSIRLGQTDVSSHVTILGPVSESLEILLSTRGGRIDGLMVDKDRKPMQGIQAVLIPDRQRDRRDLFRFATSDQTGHFTMNAIAPGDYKLFAWEDLEPGAYNDPDFLRNYEAVATPVQISESSTSTVEVKVLSGN